MDLGLNGKRAVITGGSRGIGFAIAEALAAEGVAVGLVARSADGLAAAAERLDGRGVPVATVAADVMDASALQQAVDEVAAAFGGLDLLVANAGGTVGGGNITNSGPGEFAGTLAFNAGHAAELIRAGLPHLRTAGGGSAGGGTTTNWVSCDGGGFLRGGLGGGGDVSSADCPCAGSGRNTRDSSVRSRR